MERREEESEVRRMSPIERLEMVERLTLEAWGLQEGPRLRRDVVRVIRGRDLTDLADLERE